MRLAPFFLLMTCLCTLPALATSAHRLTERTMTGTVVAIADGDTLTLLTPERQQVKVRLAEIDAPEKRQPYGQKAKAALSALAFGQQASLDVTDIDRYGRVVAIVRVGDQDVNATLVRQGAAWVYRDYLRRPALLTLEAEARQAGNGLWALPAAERMPPWTWRREQRLKREAAKLAASDHTER